jgi:hypothetical protein
MTMKSGNPWENDTQQWHQRAELIAGADACSITWSGRCCGAAMAAKTLGLGKGLGLSHARRRFSGNGKGFVLWKRAPAARCGVKGLSCGRRETLDVGGSAWMEDPSPHSKLWGLVEQGWGTFRGRKTSARRGASPTAAAMAPLGPRRWGGTPPPATFPRDFASLKTRPSATFPRDFASLKTRPPATFKPSNLLTFQLFNLQPLTPQTPATSAR